MSRESLLDFIEVLRAESPEVVGALFPEPAQEAAWYRSWEEAAQRVGGPLAELAGWLLWVEGQSPSLLRGVGFHGRIRAATPSDQFWSDGCSLFIAQALSQAVTAAQRRIAATRLLSLARQKLGQVGDEEGAEWLRRVVIEGVGEAHCGLIFEILDAEALLEGGDARAEVGLLWWWFRRVEAMWPEGYDGILRRMIGQPGSAHEVFSGVELLGALPRERLQALWRGGAVTHSDFHRFRDKPEVIVARLSGASFDLGLHLQGEVATELLASALRAPDAVRRVLIEHVAAGGGLSVGLARGLRLLADEACVGPLIRCLGAPCPQTSLEAARGLGWLGPEVAEARLKEAFMLPESCLPEGTSRDSVRQGVVEVLRIWAIGDPGRVKKLGRFLSGLLPRQSSLKARLKEIVGGKGVSGWFRREEALWRAALGWATSRDLGAEEPLVEGLDELLRAFLLVTTRGSGPQGFMAALEATRGEPMAVVAAVVALSCISPSGGWSSRPRYAAAMRDIFREDFEALLEHSVLYSRVSSVKGDQEHAIESGADLVVLHLHMLGAGESWMRAISREHLSARMTPEALRGLGALLKDRSADVRGEAVRCLGGSSDAAALPLLSEALLSERSSKVLGLIEEAMASCAPRGERGARAMGSYDPALTPDLNDLLEQVRELVHEPERSEVTWVRVCDVLQRLDAIGGLELAKGGLMGGGEGSSVFSGRRRGRPWGWREREVFQEIGRPWKEPAWIPFSAFCDPEARAAFLGHWLPRHEEGVRRKRLDPERGAGLFIHYVLEGWAWCERHNLPLDGLVVRVDSGRAGKMARSSEITSLQLVGGFGVQLIREVATRASGGDNETVLTQLSVRVPKFHMLRSDPELSGLISQGKVKLEHRVEPFREEGRAP